MSEQWYKDLPEDAFKTETDKAYEKALAAVRKGLENGLDFNAACEAIEIGDEKLKAGFVDDMLKVLIAEEHFGKDVSLPDLAKKLGVPVERMEAARKEMLEDVQETSIKAFYKGLRAGNA
ncbi:MAG: hypothetical protein P8Z71_11480 [Candidatus Sulfobium sp.]